MQTVEFRIETDIPRYRVRVTMDFVLGRLNREEVDVRLELVAGSGLLGQGEFSLRKRTSAYVSDIEHLIDWLEEPSRGIREPAIFCNSLGDLVIHRERVTENSTAWIHLELGHFLPIMLNDDDWDDSSRDSFQLLGGSLPVNVFELRDQAERIRRFLVEAWW